MSFPGSREAARRPALAAAPAIFPTPADLRRLEMLRDFDPKARRALSRMWTEIKVRWGNFDYRDWGLLGCH